MDKVNCLNPWDHQAIRQYDTDGIYPTLQGNSNGGQNRQGVCYAIEGNTVDRDSAKNGRGWCEDVSATLNTQDRHAVVFTIDAASSNSMKSGNPHSGIHETEISKCLDTMCLDPGCNQGGHMVVIALEGNGARPSHLGKGFSDDGTMYTMNTIEQHSVCYSVDCRNNELNEGISGTLQAHNNGGWSVNCTNPVCYAIENHPCDSRVTMDDSGIVQTLNARMGTGGGNVLMVLLPVCVIASTCKNAEITDGHIAPTLLNRAGTGGNQLPIVALKRTEES